MHRFNILLLCILIMGMVGCTTNSEQSNDIVIENEEMRLIISPEGMAKSLVHLPTSEECLMQNKKIPAFSLVQYDPYSDKIKASLVTLGKHEFSVDSVFRKGDNLIARFDIVDIDATIKIDFRPEYIRFSVEDFSYNENWNPFRNFNDQIKPQVDEMWFLRLPVRNRTHFGNWLNVMWDEQLAVNLLGTDPYTCIDSEERDGYRILKAGSVNEVRLTGTGAGLITTFTEDLLDNIDRLEKDFNLPQGVVNRRREHTNLSSYWSGDVNPENVDGHIEYAKKAGMRTFYVYYTAFAKSPGHYEWKDIYPNGIEDLKAVVNKIENAGIVPGVHIHYNKAGIRDEYVTPVPDQRLNHIKYFSLTESLDEEDTVLYVAENPGVITLDKGRCILKIGDELISYSDYTTTAPFRFIGCTRGVLNTTADSHRAGTVFGLLDVDSWPAFIRFAQNTDIQEEAAERMADIYSSAGFRFVYFDGAEDVHHPHWFNCSNAQWEVYKRFDPEPLFAGGAAMSHFSWHMLNRGNHYDSHLWPPERMKEAIKMFPAAEAPLMADNFTGSTFGRYQYFIPGPKTIGLQPDMIEYLTSRAAGWDSPWILKSRISEFEEHPRTPDNLEVIKRWEDVREQNWLSGEQKKMLRDLEQEHILLLNEKGEFELLPYEQIDNAANGKKEVRAFIFERNSEIYVVYWHISGKKKLELPLNSEEITLLEELGREKKVASGTKDNFTILPLDKRRYIKTGKLSREQLIDSFQNANILD